MKVVLVNGSPNEKGCTYTALKEMADEFGRQGVETEIVHIGKAAHSRLHRLRLLPEGRSLRI